MAKIVPSTKLGIINQSLGAQMGEPEIQALGEGKAGRIMDTNYDKVVGFCMGLRNWRIFTAKATLSRLATAPKNRWQYQFQLPTDCVRVITTWPPSAYEIHNRQILTNSSTCDIDYIRAVDEGFWPDWFTRVVVAYLTIRCYKGISGDDPTPAMKQEQEEARSDAEFLDSTQQPNQTLATDDFTLCRH